MVERREIADHIVARLEPAIDAMTADFHTVGQIRSCQISDLLPADLALQIFSNFPASDRMMLKRSIKGAYHDVSMKHLDPRLDELENRF